VHSTTRPENSLSVGAPGRGLGIRFLLVSSLSMMVQIVEHHAEISTDFLVEEEVVSSTPQVPNTQCRALLMCTLHGSIQLRRHPGLRRGRLREHCQQPGSCCVTLQAPQPHRGHEAVAGRRRSIARHGTFYLDQVEATVISAPT
jgi:hypothetical protein